MVLNYKKTDAMLDITDRKLHHVAPHLHGVLEMVYVTEGTLEIGVGTELYHMEEGDFAVVFPDLIHHYQVFSEGTKQRKCIHHGVTTMVLDWETLKLRIYTTLRNIPSML